MKKPGISRVFKASRVLFDLAIWPALFCSHLGLGAVVRVLNIRENILLCNQKQVF